MYIKTLYRHFDDKDGGDGDGEPYRGRTRDRGAELCYSAFRNLAAIGAATLPPAPPFWTNTAKAREPR